MKAQWTLGLEELNTDTIESETINPSVLTTMVEAEGRTDELADQGEALQADTAQLEAINDIVGQSDDTLDARTTMLVNVAVESYTQRWCKTKVTIGTESFDAKSIASSVHGVVKGAMGALARFIKECCVRLRAVYERYADIGNFFIRKADELDKRMKQLKAPLQPVRFEVKDGWQTHLIINGACDIDQSLSVCERLSKQLNDAVKDITKDIEEMAEMRNDRPHNVISATLKAFGVKVTNGEKLSALLKSAPGDNKVIYALPGNGYLVCSKDRALEVMTFHTFPMSHLWTQFKPANEELLPKVIHALREIGEQIKSQQAISKEGSDVLEGIAEGLIKFDRNGARIDGLVAMTGEAPPRAFIHQHTQNYLTYQRAYTYAMRHGGLGLIGLAEEILHANKL